MPRDNGGSWALGSASDMSFTGLELVGTVSLSTESITANQASFYVQSTNDSTISVQAATLSAP
jgi:hypothetical protein